MDFFEVSVGFSIVSSTKKVRISINLVNRSNYNKLRVLEEHLFRVLEVHLFRKKNFTQKLSPLTYHVPKILLKTFIC